MQNSRVSCDPELRSHPVIAEIEDVLSAPSSFSFKDNLSWLRNLSTGPLASAALKVALKLVADNPNYQLPQFVMDGLIRGWTFLVTDSFTISIGVRRSTPDSPVPLISAKDAHSDLKIQPYPYDVILGILHTQELEIQLLSVIQGDAPSNPSLQVDGKFSASAGDSFHLRAGLDMTLSTLSGTLVYVEITGVATSRVLPQFDPINYDFIGWISGVPIASRLELLTRVIADFEYVDAVPQLSTLTEHEDHYVRWNSIRHLLRLNIDAGLGRLRAAIHDTHPEVREAAQRTMMLIKNHGLEK